MIFKLASFQMVGNAWRISYFPEMQPTADACAADARAAACQPAS